MIANVYCIQDAKYLENAVFACGWRYWSFEMTKEGTVDRIVNSNDRELMAFIKSKGTELLASNRAKWNNFQNSMLKLCPDMYRLSEPFPVRYRMLFKRIAFVVIDCCFAIKYKITTETLKPLLLKMFAETKTSEMPEYFVILDNDILYAEMNYKLAMEHVYRYRNTPEGINQYMKYSPSLTTDGIKRMTVPFMTTHMAMWKAEKKRSLIHHASNRTRNNFNDYGQLFLMTHLRKTFQFCARVALLSEDTHMIKIANEYVYWPEQLQHAYRGLPADYLQAPYIITPTILTDEVWQTWQSANKRDWM